jgi:hypothetical protein
MANTLSISKSGAMVSAGARTSIKSRFTHEFWTAPLNVIVASGTIAIAAAVAIALIGSLASMG